MDPTGSFNLGVFIIASGGGQTGISDSFIFIKSHKVEQDFQQEFSVLRRHYRPNQVVYR